MGMDSQRTAELNKIVEAKPAGNVSIKVSELCELVAASKTENEGLKKAAEALANEDVAQLVVVQAKDLRSMLEAVAASAAPARPAKESTKASAALDPKVEPAGK